MLRMNRHLHPVLGSKGHPNDHVSRFGNLNQVIQDPSDDFFFANLDVAKTGEICF